MRTIQCTTRKPPFFFINDPATTEIYTLSLHDALPIWCGGAHDPSPGRHQARDRPRLGDRKSTRLNSSHRCISYAVFCLKKKKKYSRQQQMQMRITNHMYKYS